MRTGFPCLILGSRPQPSSQPPQWYLFVSCFIFAQVSSSILKNHWATQMTQKSLCFEVDWLTIRIPSPALVPPCWATYHVLQDRGARCGHSLFFCLPCFTCHSSAGWGPRICVSNTFRSDVDDTELSSSPAGLRGETGLWSFNTEMASPVLLGKFLVIREGIIPKMLTRRPSHRCV